MCSPERLDHHQLGPQQADALGVERGRAVDLRRLGQVDQQLGARHRRGGHGRRGRGSGGRDGCCALAHHAVRGVHGDQLAVAQPGGALARADEARDAELARHDRRMTRHAARVGDDRRGLPHQRNPVRRRHVRDEHVALVQPCGVGELADHAHGAAREAGRRAQALDQLRAQLDASVGAPVAARGRHRPRLQHPGRAVGIERPFGVLGGAVVLLDAAAQLGQLGHLVVGQRRPPPLVALQHARHGAAAGHGLDHQLLALDVAFLDVQGALVHHIAVGRHAARHDRLSEAEGALDHQLFAGAARGVDREHHARARRLDLALHDHRDVDVGLAEALLRAVEDRARTEQRGPAAAHRVGHGAAALDVQEGLVHARERGRLGVLRGRGRAHRHRCPVLALAHLRVGLHDRLLDPARQRPGRAPSPVPRSRARRARPCRRRRGRPAAPRGAPAGRSRPRRRHRSALRPRSRRAPAPRHASSHRGWRPCRRPRGRRRG